MVSHCGKYDYLFNNFRQLSNVYMYNKTTPFKQQPSCMMDHEGELEAGINQTDVTNSSLKLLPNKFACYFFVYCHEFLCY